LLVVAHSRGRGVSPGTRAYPQEIGREGEVPGEGVSFHLRDEIKQSVLRVFGLAIDA